MNKELWKDIVGYEGLYLISNSGRVLSITRFRDNGKGKYRQKTKELKQTLSSTGYKKVELYKNKIKKTVKVHRLVATHFIANPENLNVINHIDGNKLNNDYKNLEWVSQSENIQHAYDNNLIDSFDIDKRSLEELYINKNMSANEIAKLFNISQTPIINKLKDYQIPVSRRTTYQINEKILEEKIKSGFSNKKLAEEIGCDPSLISHYAKRIRNGGRIYG